MRSVSFDGAIRFAYRASLDCHQQCIRVMPLRNAKVALATLVVLGTTVAGEKSGDVMATQFSVLNISAIILEHDVDSIETMSSPDRQAMDLRV